MPCVSKLYIINMIYTLIKMLFIKLKKLMYLENNKKVCFKILELVRDI